MQIRFAVGTFDHLNAAQWRRVQESIRKAVRHADIACRASYGETGVTFRAPLARASTRQRSAALLGLLSVLVAANVQWLRQHPKTPHPYSVPGLRYVREAPGSEEWRGIEQILKHRSGDCEDLASYLCAWLIAHEHRAAIRLVWRTFDELGEDGRTIWHVQVRRTVTDEVMDPSKRLGMEGDA